ncbi:MAG: sensor histidine kinase [Deltaproteobacteria bacterium]|nr:sensor histidine kinase [Deltaproteobacteria bacterium]
MKLRAPANVLLRRAQLVFMLAILVPTILMTATGIIVLIARGSEYATLVAGVLVLVFCVLLVTGYILGTILVARGARLARVQNDFLSAVSHEVRTPMTSMRMFIDTLREGRVTDPAEQKRCLDIIHQEMGRLDGLVERLIELSRIESGRHAFEHKPVPIRAVVDEALAAFAAVRVGADVDLKVEVEDGLMVRGDRAALAQAVGNLLVNAWKYTGADKRIELTARHQGQRHVAITVADNGAGIPREEQRAVFDKFERGRAAIEGGQPGSGLGLAVVRAIVTAHGGKIDLESEPRHGSRFKIVLKQVTA